MTSLAELLAICCEPVLRSETIYIRRSFSAVNFPSNQLFSTTKERIRPTWQFNW